MYEHGILGHFDSQFPEPSNIAQHNNHDLINTHFKNNEAKVETHYKTLRDHMNLNNVVKKHVPDFTPMTNSEYNSYLNNLKINNVYDNKKAKDIKEKFQNYVSQVNRKNLKRHYTGRYEVYNELPKRVALDQR